MIAFRSLLIAPAIALAGAALADPAPAPAPSPSPALSIPALAIAHAESGLLLSIATAGKRLVAVGGNGAIVVSEDGAHWTQVPSPVDVTLTGVAFADALHGWAVGHDALILHTDDGGLHWTIQNLQADLNSPMFAVLAISDQQALAVGGFGMLKSTRDGGKTWTDLAPPAVVEDKLHLNAVTRLASGELMVAGERGLVALSADGDDWQRLKAPYEGSFFGVLPWGDKGAIAFGMRGNVYAIEDVHAADWHKIETRTTGSFFGGQALADRSVVLSGTDGQIVAISPQGEVRSLVKNTVSTGRPSNLAGSARFGESLVVVGEPGVFSVPMK